MDVYKIGVSIALANGVSAVLAVIQRDVLGLHKAVNMTTGGFNRMKVAAVGAAGVVIGGAMLTGLLHLEKAGEKYTHQLELMRHSAGMTFSEIEQAQRQANRTAANVLTTLPSENLKAIRELRAVFPHYEDALHNLDMVQRASAVMANLRDSQGERHGLARGTEQVYEMSKAAEMQGAAQDPARFARMVDGMVKASQWSGGKITGSDFHSMLKYMRGAGVNLSDRFVMEMLPSIIQEFKTGKGGASGVGVGFAGLMRYVVGGHMSHRSIQAGLDYGLVDPKKVIRKPNGSIAGLGTNGFYGAELAQSDPDKWVDQYVLPALRSHGVNMSDPKKLTSVIASVFEGRVSQQWIEQFILPALRARLDADVPKITGSGGVAAYGALARNDPVMVRDQFHKQLERVAESLGKVAAPMVTETLYQITQGIAWFAGVIERHPVAAKWLIAFVAALGGMLVVLGTLALVGAGISALGGIGMATSIAAVVGGLVALSAGLAWLAHGGDWRAAIDVLKRGAVEWGRAIQRGWDVVLPVLQRGAAEWGNAIQRGWDVVMPVLERGAAEWGRVMLRGLERITTSLGEFFSAWGAVIVLGYQRVNVAIHEWIDSIPALAGQLAAALLQVSAAILSWVASLPGKLGQEAIEAVKPGYFTQPGGAVNPNPGIMPGVPGGAPLPSLRDRDGPRGLFRQGSYVPPPRNDNIEVTSYTMLDGEVIAKTVTNRIARGASGPSGGTTGPDVRAGLFGGMGGVPA